MIYDIKYAGGQCCNTAYGRNDLLEWLKLLKDETITDIIKLSKNGASESVIDRYKKYIVHIGNKDNQRDIGLTDRNSRR